MYEEYENKVKVPKEIQKIRDEIIFGLEIRELKFSCAALAVIMIFAVLYMKITASAGIETNMYDMYVLITGGAILAAPFIILGFGKRALGIEPEDWIAIWYSQKVKSAPVRKLIAKNEYEVLMETARVKKYDIIKSKRKFRGYDTIKEIEMPEEKKKKKKARSRFALRR